MVNLNYHIYSLVAVFLALGIGALVGISIQGGPGGSTAIEQQTQQIQKLQEQFKAQEERMGIQRALIERLHGGLKESDALAARALPVVTANQLAGRGVAIVQFGAADQLARQVVSAMESAGASLTTTTTMELEYGLEIPEQMEKASKLTPMEFQDSSKEPYQQFWGYLASVIAGGKEGNPLESFTSAGILRGEGDYTRPNRFVVLVIPGSEDPKKLLDLYVRPLTDKLKQNNITLALVTTTLGTDIEDRRENAWLQIDLPTVTHIDYAFGQISLVSALLDGKGHYGLGPSEEILPKRVIAP